MEFMAKYVIIIFSFQANTFRMNTQSFPTVINCVHTIESYVFKAYLQSKISSIVGKK